MDRTNSQSITVGGKVVKNSTNLAGSGCCFLYTSSFGVSVFTDTLPHAANPYGATTIRTSPTRVAHSPLSSNPFSGLMLPELLALTGNFESTTLHSEPSYSQNMVVSTGNAPVFWVYQTHVLLLYDKTNGTPAQNRTEIEGLLTTSLSHRSLDFIFFSWRSLV